MSIPKEPRQQMISIMYLVLTALLALNVSAEIIEAFKRFNNSMEESNVTVESKIAGTYRAFEAEVEKNQGRGQEHLDRAYEATTLSKEVVDQLQKIKADFQAFTDEGVSEEALANSGGGLVNASSQDATTRFFVKGTPDGRTPVSPDLRELMGNTRQQFLNYFADSPDSLRMVSELIPEFVPEQTGEKDFFYQLPAVAAMTEITRYESLVKSAESTVVKKLSERVGVKNEIIDVFSPAVIPNGTKFITGDPIDLDIFLSASSSKTKPLISLDGKPLKVDANGIASFSKKTGSTGKKSVNIEIKAPNQFGEMQSYKDKFEYEVVPPFKQEYKAVVSPSKMNVFYIGVDNPIECGISGIAGDKLSASISGYGSTITPQGNGKFMVRVKEPTPKGKAVKVTVSGPKPEFDRDGGSHSETKDFRSKLIPDPVAEIGGQIGGRMATGTFKAQLGIDAKLYGFDFDAKFKVISFDVTYAPKRDDLQTKSNQGQLFSSDVKSLMSRVKPGDSFFFDNITVVGPDGTNRNLGTIGFNIK